jgi:hypothetical protein
MGRVLTAQVSAFPEYDARIAKLEAENASLRKQAASPLKLKVSTKGAISVYGLGRFPVTLYRSQMERLIGEVDTIKDFITANSASLAVKGQ